MRFYRWLDGMGGTPLVIFIVVMAIVPATIQVILLTLWG